MGVPVYATTGQRIWYYSFRVICGLIFFFLIAPIMVIIPLSFNAENFFTFTPEMLVLDPAGFSTKHYEDFFTNSDWQLALRNSLKIAFGIGIIMFLVLALAGEALLVIIAGLVLYNVVPAPLKAQSEEQSSLIQEEV